MSESQPADGLQPDHDVTLVDDSGPEAEVVSDGSSLKLDLDDSDEGAAEEGGESEVQVSRSSSDSEGSEGSAPIEQTPKRARKATSAKKDELLPGPRCVDDALRWPDMLKRAFDVSASSGSSGNGDQAMWDQFVQNVKLFGIEVSTEFSGSGMAEISCGYLGSLVEQGLSDEEKVAGRCMGFTFKRSGDLLQSCRKLLAHNQFTKGRCCIFGDVLTRMKDAFKLEVNRVIADHKDEDLDLGHGTRSIEDDLLKALMNAQSAYGRNMRAVRAWCFKCEKTCTVFGEDCDNGPRPPEVGRIRVHVAGVICTFWSQRGTMKKLLGESTTAFMERLLERTIEREDIIHSGPAGHR
ncbi:unnamed protein product [Prorocentrum cordatum]|uniref:Uncharacterized protein n=1 Tax=Prorocentrum cordatum TaxID=2364126 RepID=A0ABN9TW87_9DINO|nr:unnamed protein product [Polarella glacialis]